MGNAYPIAEYLGDGISSELQQSVHRIAKSLPFEVEFHPVDLSLENRRKRKGTIFQEALDAIRKYGTAIKYPTTTAEDDESPNKLLRELCNFSVIHRPVCTIPGIPTNFKKSIDLDIVRIATGGTYDDAGRKIGADSAVSIRVIERRPCMEAARFAFELARRKGTFLHSASKYTIQRETDGLFENAVNEVAKQYPDVIHKRELFDALLGNLIMFPENYRVIVTPNEYGDFLSDSACGLIGSIGLGDSNSFSFTKDAKVALAMFDPAGGTAPTIAGKDIANPSAALFAFSSLLIHIGEHKAGRALKASILELIQAGESTHDIGGSLGTKAFSETVAKRLETNLAAQEKKPVRSR